MKILPPAAWAQGHGPNVRRRARSSSGRRRATAGGGEAAAAGRRRHRAAGGGGRQGQGGGDVIQSLLYLGVGVWWGKPPHLTLTPCKLGKCVAPPTCEKLTLSCC